MTKPTCRALIALAAAALPATAHAQPGEGKSYILGVAVSRYDTVKSGFRPLDKAAPDLVAVLDRVSSEGKATAYYLTQTQAKGHYEPSSQNVRLVLGEFAKSVTAADRVVVVMLGHGFENTRGSVFCTSNCDLDDPKSMISVREVVARVKALPAREKLVLIDACRDFRDQVRVHEEVGEEDDSVTRPKPAGPASTTVVVQSCSPGQVAFTRPTTGKALMTSRLAEALAADSPADADRDGKVTVREVVDYLRKYVRDDARAVEQKPQDVYAAEEGSVGSFALVRCNVPQAGAAARRPEAAGEVPVDTRTSPLGVAGGSVPRGDVRYGPGIAQGPRPLAVGGNQQFPVLSSSGFDPNRVVPGLGGALPTVNNPIPAQWRPGNGNIIRSGLGSIKW